ncbi:hypothetical protein CBL_03187 [Carabus blaptoides fortunei]
MTPLIQLISCPRELTSNVRWNTRARTRACIHWHTYASAPRDSAKPQSHYWTMMDIMKGSKFIIRKSRPSEEMDANKKLIDVEIINENVVEKSPRERPDLRRQWCDDGGEWNKQEGRMTGGRCNEDKGEIEENRNGNEGRRRYYVTELGSHALGSLQDGERLTTSVFAVNLSNFSWSKQASKPRRILLPRNKNENIGLQGVGFTSELSDETLMSCGDGPRLEHITRSSTIYSIEHNIVPVPYSNSSVARIRNKPTRNTQALTSETTATLLRHTEDQRVLKKVPKRNWMEGHESFVNKFPTVKCNVLHSKIEFGLTDRRARKFAIGICGDRAQVRGGQAVLVDVGQCLRVPENVCVCRTVRLDGNPSTAMAQGKHPTYKYALVRNVWLAPSDITLACWNRRARDAECYWDALDDRPSQQIKNLRNKIERKCWNAKGLLTDVMGILGCGSLGLCKLWMDQATVTSRRNVDENTDDGGRVVLRTRAVLCMASLTDASRLGHVSWGLR